MPIYNANLIFEQLFCTTLFVNKGKISTLGFFSPMLHHEKSLEKPQHNMLKFHLQTNLPILSYRPFLAKFFRPSLISINFEKVKSPLFMKGNSNQVVLQFVVNIFDSFVPVIIFKTLKFNSSVLFGTHTILDRSLRVLQLFNVNHLIFYLSSYFVAHVC